MYTSTQELIDIFKNLLKEHRINQAILFDAPWGSGKTYFIKEHLIPALEKASEESGANYDRILYISLFGMSGTNEITDAIYSSYMAQFVRDKVERITKEHTKKSIDYTKLLTVGSKLALTIVKSNGAETDYLPKPEELFSPHSLVIIFDDLERCQIPFPEVYGYINNLVEHSGTKIILVSCKKHLKDEEIKEQHEKLIGLTIKYQPNYSEIYENIINKYFPQSYIGNLLLTLNDWTIQTLQKAKHLNFRTLQYALLNFDYLYPSLELHKCKDANVWESELINIYKYIVFCSIFVRTNQPLPSWNTSYKTNEVMEIYFTWYSNDIPISAYHFVHTFLRRHYINMEEIAQTLSPHLEMLTRRKRSNEIIQKQAFNKLEQGKHRNLGDQELINKITQLPVDITEDFYSVDIFGDIIALLIDFKEIYPFMDCTIDRVLRECSQSMVKLLQTRKDIYSSRLTHCKYDNPEKIDLYNHYTTPILSILKDREPPSTPGAAYGFHYWGQDFNDFCRNRTLHDLYIRTLFQHIDPNWLVEQVASSSIKDLRLFTDGISYLYIEQENAISSSSTEIIMNILSQIDMIDIKTQDVNYKYALVELQETLQQIIDKQKKNEEEVQVNS